METVELGNEKNAAFGIGVTDDSVIIMWLCYTLWLRAVGET